MELSTILECVSAATGIPSEEIRSNALHREVVRAKRIFMACAAEIHTEKSRYPTIADYVGRNRATMNVKIARHLDQLNHRTYREYTDIFKESMNLIEATKKSPKFGLINRLEQLYKQRLEVELAIATNEAALVAEDKTEGVK